MSDSEPKPAEGIQDTTPPTEAIPQPGPVDRTDLVEKARTFLHSPQVRSEDNAAKRKFLVEKGLTDVEIEGLLGELPAPTPVIPPRTYPQPPPSNLPNLLIGLARIISWIVGGSAAVLFMYFRYLYPRLTRSYQARLALQSHQKELLGKLTSSLQALKEEQAETYALLPHPQPFKEDTKFEKCRSLDDVLGVTDKVESVPHLTLLRCTLEELATKNKPATSEAVFDVLEEKVPWMKTEEGAQFAEKLWASLTTIPLFKHEEEGEASVWKYSPPITPPAPPLVSSLTALKQSLPESQPQPGRSQHTLQALSDLTGYLTTKTYSVSSVYRAIPSALSTEEDEVRREIRALKGLVLNRRSFMSSIPISSVTHPSNVTP